MLFRSHWLCQPPLGIPEQRSLLCYSGPPPVRRVSHLGQFILQHGTVGDRSAVYPHRGQMHRPGLSPERLGVVSELFIVIYTAAKLRFREFIIQLSI